MRKFLSNLLLTIFIVVFSYPFSVLAQTYSWTPPTSAPPGANTPSPINVSTATQAKRGTLNITNSAGDLSHTLNTNFFASFKPGGFYGSELQVGRGPSGDIVEGGGGFGGGGNTEEIPGPPDAVDVANPTPSSLTVRWSHPSSPPVAGNSNPTHFKIYRSLASSNANPGTLITTVPVNPGPPPSFLQTYTDNTLSSSTTYRYRVSAVNSVGESNPFPSAGVTGTTTGIQQPGGTGFNFQFPNLLPSVYAQVLPTGPTVSTLLNIYGGIRFRPSSGTPPQAGYVLTSADRHGNIVWAPGAVTPPPVDSLPTGTIGQTLRHNGTAWEANSSFRVVPGATGTIELNDPIVKITNPDTKPGAGRIPYSLSNDGQFSWNPSFTYTESLGQVQQSGEPQVLRGTLTLKNPTSTDASIQTISVFVNDGMSILRDNVVAQRKLNVQRDLRVEQMGDLYLDDVEIPRSDSSSIFKPLCLNTTTGKVVRCDIIPTTTSQNPDGPTPSVEKTVVYTIGQKPTHPQPGIPADATFNVTDNQHVFPVTGQVTIKYCGGGGGGGGGGIGYPGNPNNWDQTGTGGAGGGGGGAGECRIVQVNVAAGDILSFSIGSSGGGGINAGRQHKNGQDYINRVAGPGFPGNFTTISLNGDGSNRLPALGGWGGQPGNSVGSQNESPIGGVQGFTPELGSQELFNNGQNGYISTNNQCNGCGGSGGHGVVVVNGQSTLVANSGGGGYPSSNTRTKIGGNGGFGKLSSGGGGGGGSDSTQYLEGDFRTFFGGFGGSGGNGYVMVTYLAQPDPPEPVIREMQFTTNNTSPGGGATCSTTTTHMICTVNVTSAMAGILTMEIIGAGGNGGDGAYTQLITGYGGGGGGGSGSRINGATFNITSGTQLVIGVGKSENSSYVTYQGVTITAGAGGRGNNGTSNSNGNGGVPGVTTNPNGTNGRAGTAGMSGDGGAGGASLGGVPAGNGKGGNGGSRVSYQGNTNPGGAGSPGYVKISW